MIPLIKSNEMSLGKPDELEFMRESSRENKEAKMRISPEICTLELPGSMSSMMKIKLETDF